MPVDPSFTQKRKVERNRDGVPTGRSETTAQIHFFVGGDE